MNENRFDGRAQDYTAGRPDYSPMLIDYMYDSCGLSASSVIADIGSGTGKFAAALLERGSEVYCVEPNDDMRHTAEKELSGYPQFHAVNGNAEHTSLAASSVGCVTTAQAFHWFDVNCFRQECRRIIKGTGYVFLIWNIMDMKSPLNSDMHRIYTRFCHSFRGFGGGIGRDDPRIAEFFSGRYERLSFDHPLYYDRQKFIARCLSGSYSLKEGDTNYDEYISAVSEVFDKYSESGTVTMENCTVAYFGKI